LEKWTTTAAITPATTATDASPAQNSVASYGFLREIQIRLRNSSAADSGNLAADSPQKILSNIQLTDPNGAEIYGGPTWGGYEAYLAEKYGSYKSENDPNLSSLASISATTPLWIWRIPLEMAESSGFGALPNMDAQAPYKLKTTVDTRANIWTTVPTTFPAFLFDYIIRCWTVPDAVNKLSGQRQTVFPPGIGVNLSPNLPGVGCTVQHWSLSTPAVTAATAMNAALLRKGNDIRNLVLVARGAANARVALSNFPNPITFQIDGAPLWAQIDPAIIVEMWQRRDSGQTAAANATSVPVASPADTGVLPVMFSNIDGDNLQGGDGTLGAQGFLGTNQASRIEFGGTWGASITALQALTNDVNGVSLEGSSYAFAYSQQLSSPSQPSVRSGR
jgi:hypothetical protein